MPDFRAEQTGTYITFDYVKYYRPVAGNLLHGRGLVLDNGAPAILYPPGYPLLIAAAIGVASLLSLPEEVALGCFTLLCMGLGSLFIYLLARTIWKPGLALMSALGWATYPFVQWLAKEPRSEVPFMLFFYAAVLFAWWGIQRRSLSWQPYLLSGLLTGGAMLIRPIAAGVGLLLAAFVLFTLRVAKMHVRLALAGVLLLGSLVVVLPWEAWVYNTTGKIVPLSTGSLPSMIDGLTFAVNRKDYREEISVPQDVRDMMQRFQDRSSQVRTTGELATIIGQEITGHPVTAAKFLIIKAARSFYATDSGRLEVPSAVVQAVYICLFLLATYTAWKYNPAARPLILLLWAVLLYFWAMSILVLSILRYLAPTLGLLFVLLPALFNRVWMMRRGRLQEDSVRREGTA